MILQVSVDGGWGEALGLEVVKSHQIDPGRVNICESGMTWFATARILRRRQESDSETGWLVGSEVMGEEARAEREEA